jgi:hypothetical protein
MITREKVSERKKEKNQININYELCIDNCVLPGCICYRDVFKFSEFCYPAQVQSGKSSSGYITDNMGGPKTKQ